VLVERNEIKMPNCSKDKFIQLMIDYHGLLLMKSYKNDLEKAVKDKVIVASIEGLHTIVAALFSLSS
jgi:hypothetical protein